MKHLVKFLSIATFALTLTACETMEGIKADLSDFSIDSLRTAAAISDDPQADFLRDGNCPTIQIVGDLGRLYEFNAGQSMKSDNLVSSVEMRESQSTCQFNERSVTVDLKLEFDGKLGPKGRSTASEKPFFSYPFFVAVTNSSGKILAKEIFAASMTYDPGQSEKLYFETLRQIIPADTRAIGASYKVMVGFQLAEAQLAYNRQLMEQERLAAQKIEMQRIAAEEAAKKAELMRIETENAKIKATAKAEKVAAETAAKSGAPIVVTPSANNNGQITAPKATRAGPFDIFKTDDQ